MPESYSSLKLGCMSGRHPLANGCGGRQSGVSGGGLPSLRTCLRLELSYGWGRAGPEFVTYVKFQTRQNGRAPV